jgi:hypothetical protein
MENNDKSIKDQTKLVDLNSGIELLEFLYATLPLTPHQIGIG